MLDSYNFTRPETNQVEKVEPERWCWEAIYEDGTVLKQFDTSDGNFHQLKEINQSQMAVFRMVNYDSGKFFDVKWHSARKLIHFYNNNVLDNGERFVRLYCFGYQTQINGTDHNVILVILPDDSVVITEDINETHIT